MTAPMREIAFTVTDFPGGNKSFVELPFHVDDDIERVEVSYTFSPGSVIDLGVARNGVMRGWSGAERGHVVVEADAATPGYDAGPIPGEWHVVLGVVKVGPECRVNVAVRLVERVHRWLVGDPHTHTEHSDGGVTVLDAIHRARLSRLDFVGLADHNTIAQNFIRPDDPSILVLPAMELTTYWGHIGLYGLPVPVRDWRCRTPSEVADHMREAKENGATVVVNHPFQNSDGGRYQAGWDATFDAIEIWNGTWARHNVEALAFWRESLVEGRRWPITGGSDFHLKNRRRHGRPSNRLFAGARTIADILDAMRAGRNVVGFAEEQTTVEPTDAGSPMFGACVAAGTPVSVTFRGLTRGDEIRVITERGEIEVVKTQSGLHVHEGRLEGRFLRFEVWQGETPRLFTNPIYAD